MGFALPKNSLAWGQALLRAGMVPIPLCRDSKQISYHAIGLTPYHAFEARKRFKDVAFQSLTFQLALQPPDRATVLRWLERHDGNIGIVAGHGGLVVLDFDDKAAYRVWAEIAGSHADTPTEETQAGYHVYLRCHQPVACSSFYLRGRKVGHVKGYGGYVACAPSRLGGVEAYRWLDGKSPLELPLAQIPDLETISVDQRGPLRRAYERLFSRGTYEPDETPALPEILPVRGGV